MADRWLPPIRAYVREACGPDAAAAAEPAAVASLVAATGAPGYSPARTRDLALDAARGAAADHAPAPSTGGISGAQRALRRAAGRGTPSACEQMPKLLIARRRGELTEADLQRLAAHLARRASCRDLEAGFEQAEKAFQSTALAQSSPNGNGNGGAPAVASPEPKADPEPKVEPEPESEPVRKALGPSPWAAAKPAPEPEPVRQAPAPSAWVAAAKPAPEPEAPPKDVTPAPVEDEEPSAAEPPREPPAATGETASRGRPRWLLPVALLAIVAAAAVLILVFATGGDDSGQRRTAARPQATPPPAAPAQAAPTTPATPATPPADTKIPLDGALANDYDPLGDDEHAEQARLAIDGDPATTWSTEKYEQGALNKDGVGIYVRLPDKEPISAIKIDTPRGGWSAEVYGSNAEPPKAWPSKTWTELGSADPVRAGKRIPLDSAGKGFKYALVWITTLPKESAKIGEIQLYR